MKLPALRRTRRPELPGVTGVARLDRRTRNLTKRLNPGDIAIIDHIDIDRLSAEALVAGQVAAVVNVETSISGRYPNLGPEIIVPAGIPLLDAVGPDVFGRISEGDVVRVDDATIYRGSTPVAHGTPHDTQVHHYRDGRRPRWLGRPTRSVHRQRRGIPPAGARASPRRRRPSRHSTTLDGRHALIVVAGYQCREDVLTLRPYIRDYRPVLIGVDGGADALLEAGLRPQIIVGDMDSVSDAALGCGAELVVRAYRDGCSPGMRRLARLGLPAVAFPASGTSEDVAMLLVDGKGAELIVAVGTHATLVELLDTGGAGMASTFLTRLRVGGKLVDAKHVRRLYHHHHPSMVRLLFLVLASAVLVVVALALSPTAR